jgi:hypothetical protein
MVHPNMYMEKGEIKYCNCLKMGYIKLWAKVWGWIGG